ncbi:hypothetical protein [Corynebacterium lowii]|uniref:Cell wall anchor protein n=1 Tax=Corynebacterium lowii TaxID=1544413 RepID=A0A0Q1AIH5_9CORY|nr:hypothetical protein [Corynebacterium lowii]KQB86484.1 hypothetical protein Clow_01408 [Corynebacterium lowii]MDP9850968.1 uncharacterized SAM-binding protein YcdF (DUF218 family) [Corynebacterium lowii]
MSAFDIRNVIGALMGLYGLLLCACFFLLDPGVNPDDATAKSAADNLWTGLALVAVALVFFLWARLSPIQVEEHHA